MASEPLKKIAKTAKFVMAGPQMVPFTPAIALGAFWIGGEPALLVAALGLPLLYSVAGSAGMSRPVDARATDATTGLLLEDSLEDHFDRFFSVDEAKGTSTACALVHVANLDEIEERHGPAAVAATLRAIGERLASVVRAGDTIVSLNGARFGIGLRPSRRMDLESAIQLSDRLLAAAQDAVILDGVTIYPGCAVGFCLSGKAPERTPESIIASAKVALEDALVNGPNTIRAYNASMRRRNFERDIAMDEAARALDQGQIVAWYQPQISTDTGEVTGFETLARWDHPERGILTPNHFLPQLERAGCMERLGELMMYQALGALKEWEAADHHVPRIGVNFAEAELNNPKLLDKVRWELDRFGLSPDRLAVEILENVVSTSPDDNVTRNIAGLAKLGCMIDLDDFGTGSASIAAIRRFAVGRIKIDRSFVTRLDTDPEQQRMLSAILTMAQQLGLETLAEGVETVGEHAILAQLGCDHVQGFGIARPMPFEKTQEWIAEHRAKLADTPTIGRRTG